MMNRLINLLRYLKLIFVNRTYYKLSIDGHLHKNGFFKSTAQSGIVSSEGKYLPWLTYPFLNFFIPRLQNKWSIYEFGAGYSTLFFHEQQISYTSIEDDRQWYDRICKLIGNGERIAFAQTKEAYLNDILTHQEPFDIIIIDGSYRADCVRPAIQNLTANGVIILDNSESEPLAKQHLADAGFKSIDFQGLQSLGYRSTTTSVFYRNDNILEI